MRKIGLAIILAATLGAGAAMTGAAQATPVNGSGLGTAAVALGLVEQAQFVVGGRNYCWYNGGWHGPGWYWCGYAWRRGYGWGGVRGWNGWVWGGWHRGWRGGRHWHHWHH